jgi:hypothetical protein
MTSAKIPLELARSKHRSNQRAAVVNSEELALAITKAAQPGGFFIAKKREGHP